jgi:hypothetical protein
MGALFSHREAPAAIEGHVCEPGVRIDVRSSSLVVYIYAGESISSVGNKRKRGDIRSLSISLANGQPQTGARVEIAAHALGAVDSGVQAIHDAGVQAVDDAGVQAVDDPGVQAVDDAGVQAVDDAAAVDDVDYGDAAVAADSEL